MLELKKQEFPKGDSSGDATLVYYNLPPDMVATLNRKRKSLEAAIMKFEPIIEQLEELWEFKVNIFLYFCFQNLSPTAEV